MTDLHIIPPSDWPQTGIASPIPNDDGGNAETGTGSHQRESVPLFELSHTRSLLNRRLIPRTDVLVTTGKRA